MARLILLVQFFVLSLACMAQDPDTTRLLEAVEIQGYRFNRPLEKVPVSAAVVTPGSFERYNDRSILPALNTIPGVRMEERSPGSYRIAFRGSSLRSPFGVRNVKFYWNGMPFTDAGGNTYLNLFDISMTTRLELIKGPSGSLYGAGTGGVVLLETAPLNLDQITTGVTVGSYGFRRVQAGANLATSALKGSINYMNQEFGGYRTHTNFSRHIANANLQIAADAKNTVTVALLYADIFYQTPGGLTRTEWENDPRQARPSTKTSRGAEEQNAFVTNESLFIGAKLDHQYSEKWTSTVVVNGLFSGFHNMAVNEYEKRDERNLSIRNENEFMFNTKGNRKVTFGFEHQLSYAPIRKFENNRGEAGQMKFENTIANQQLIIFGQLDYSFADTWFLTAGISQTWLTYDFSRVFPSVFNEAIVLAPVASPRVALLKEFGSKVSVYGSASAGFSPPTNAEILPSDNSFYNDLKPERGVNFEVGARYYHKRLKLELTGYQMHLQNTIVIQRKENNAEYFVNAGKTNQRGIESSVLFRASDKISLWGSYTYNHYIFKEYVKSNENFSGNRMPGLPPVVVALGADVNLPVGVYANITGMYNDHIALTDANDEYAGEYYLLNARVGYRKKLLEKLSFDFFASVDNALDRRYSLGNDLNAMGRRFYNAAPARNFASGIKLAYQLD